MRYCIFCVLAWLAFLPAAHAAEDATASSIVAVVNDEVISALDIQDRMRMVIATAQLEDTAEVRERLQPQILRSLMDEKIQMQEATRNGIEIKPKDIEEAVRGIEAQREMPSGTLPEKLTQLGVPWNTFEDQIRAQLAWTKLVLKTIRPRVRISDDEIERECAKIKQGSGEAEVKIAVLALGVDRPEHDAQVRALGEKLASEIQKGAAFEAVAKELGSGQNSAPFWTTEQDLDPAIRRALENKETGGLAGPVRTLEGYVLVKLLERRKAQASTDVTEVVIKDILLKLKFDASKQDVDLMLNIGRDAAKNPGNCTDPGLAGVTNLADYDIQVNFRRERLEEMAASLKEIVNRLSVGEVSEPYASREGIRLFMLCERVEKPGELASREEVSQNLYQQKLELEAQKYLRDLRREAAVEVRL